MYLMSTITVNVSTETAHQFRKKAYGLLGKKKGTLGKAVNEAMQEWIHKQDYLNTCMKLLETGKNMGKIMYKTRDELHERH